MTLLRWALCLSIGLSLCFALWRPSDSGGVIAGLEGRFLDARFLLRGPLPSPETLAILAIDDATLTEAKSFPLPRDAIGTAIKTAQDNGAIVVALDLLLPEHSEEDAFLKEATSGRIQSVLAISFLDTIGHTRSEALEKALVRSAPSTMLNPPSGHLAIPLAPPSIAAAMSPQKDLASE